MSLPAPPEAPAPGARPSRPRGSGLTVEALAAITELVVQTVPACDHAAIIVTPRRGVEIAGSSDERAAAAVELMLQGDPRRTPALLRSADVIDEPDLSDTTAWPTMAQALVDRGIGGVLAHRLRSGERRLGVLVLLGGEPGALRAVDRGQLASLSMLVSGWVVAHEAAARVGHLQVALENARLMGRAVGLLMGRQGLRADDAVARLRTMSNRLNLRMHDIAATLLTAHESRAAGQVTTPSGTPAVPAGDEAEPAAAEAVAAVEQALDAAGRHAPPA